MKKITSAALVGGAGSANASCASVNGHSVGKDCKSTVGSASVALGANAHADSAGPGSVAVAVGNPGPNHFYPNTILPTTALADGTGSTAVAVGNGSNAGSLGDHDTALVIGNHSNAYSYGGNTPVEDPPGTYVPFAGNHNTSVTVANNAEAGAVGNHKVSINFRNGTRMGL